MCIRDRRNMAAIASAPSAIRATMMIRTRLPPERCTTSGLSPVMVLLGYVMRVTRRTGRGGVYVEAVRRSREGPAEETSEGSVRRERSGLGVVDREDLGEAAAPVSYTHLRAHETP